jgi:hypothetical protein
MCEIHKKLNRNISPFVATRTLPAEVRALRGVVAVAAGQAHSAAICSGMCINIIIVICGICFFLLLK